MNLVERLGVSTLMDKTAKEELHKALLTDVPECTVENIRATVESLHSDAGMIFKRGLAVAFSRLDRRFRSHDGFKIGSRVVLTRAFDDYGSWNYSADHRATLTDVERVFAVLDGNRPDPQGLIDAINADRQRGLRPHQSETESTYFKIRVFKNGNAHLWFTRDDLVKKANKLLAEYYGELIPDAWTRGDAPPEPRSTAVAKDLQFYATPNEVADRVLGFAEFGKGAHVLEPSAGEGNLARALVSMGCSVDAVEIEPTRARKIEALRLPGTTVKCANFLDLPASPTYDAVVMNPPFYGTHWIDHIKHAFDFLCPGGQLIAILPATAEFGESKKHEAYRKWTDTVSTGWNKALYRQLPPESFVTSGTRVSTVFLTMRKPNP